jgi:hypothetical protein
LLVVVAAIAVAVVSIILFAAVRWNGSLGHAYSAGSGLSMPVRPSRPFTIGVDELSAPGRFRIESVRLHGSPRGAALVGAVLHDGAHGMVGAERRFPPTSLDVTLRPARGAVVPAHTKVVLEIGIVVAHPVRVRIEGVDVLYRVRWHGIDVPRRAHVGSQAFVCATTRPLVAAQCPIPDDRS